MAGNYKGTLRTLAVSICGWQIFVNRSKVTAANTLKFIHFDWVCGQFDTLTKNLKGLFWHPLTFKVTVKHYLKTTKILRIVLKILLVLPKFTELNHHNLNNFVILHNIACFCILIQLQLSCRTLQKCHFIPLFWIIS
jgi:hypothetical protein